MRPFLHLTVREHEGATVAEHAAVASCSGLAEDDLVLHRLDRTPLPPFDARDWGGVFVGGGQFNASDAIKSPTQQRVEADLDRVVASCLDHDVPLLGLCYGVGVLTRFGGGVVDRAHGEPAGAAVVTLTDAGASDPLFAGLPASFPAFTGHKEACSRLPEEAVLLASGERCPVQAFRLGRCYATQFHPELDADRLAERMLIYADGGYFDPDSFDDTVAAARASGVGVVPARILHNFVGLAQGRREHP